MKLIFMGTGTSQGVPVIAGKNSALNLDNPKNWRTRSSIHIEIANKHIQVDASPEFRLQCLKNNINWIDTFILTHGHADHIAGMDDLRRFCDMIEGNVLKVYSNEYGIQRIKSMFPYALNDKPNKRGYPCFDVNLMPNVIDLDDEAKIYSTSLPHCPVETLGLIFCHKDKKIAYFSDCKLLTAEAISLAKHADIAILDALRTKEHKAHMSLQEALDFSEILQAKTTYLTHTTSEFDYDTLEPTLPKNCHMAYDNLTIEI